MSSPRIRRLRLDYQCLQERLNAWGPIQIVEAIGDPPERYGIVYRVKGLAVGAGGEIHERDEHHVKINLTLDYPRRAPQCKILGSIFHPNFDATTVCIGDFWAASEGLDELIIRIGRMIAYQEYNTKSPLNGLAAKWAAENAHLLPVDAIELAPPSHAEPESLAAISISNEQTATPPADAAPSTAQSGADGVSSEKVVVSDGASEQETPSHSSAAAEQTEPVKLGAELSLIHLKVRCEACSAEFGIPLSAVEAQVVCPNCKKEHKLAKTFKCCVLESAGLFWFTAQ